MPSANDNRKTLYIGNLDQRVVDYMLREIFSAIGPVKHVKIIAGGKTVLKSDHHETIHRS